MINGSLDTAGQNISEPEVVTIGTTQMNHTEMSKLGETRAEPHLAQGPCQASQGTDTSRT